MGNEIGLSSGVITKWKKKGNLPATEQLNMVADFFNCSIDYLLGRTDNSKSHILGNEFTVQETELLNIFRSLPKKWQDNLFTTAKMFSENIEDDYALVAKSKPKNKPVIDNGNIIT